MSQQYLGEIRAVSFAFPPKGWALCNGQLMALNQNQALFSLLGTQYGGNGINNFALPDLRGRTPTAYQDITQIGAITGSEQVTMTLAQLPAHTHQVQASTTAATASDPTGQVWAPVVDGSGISNMGFTENPTNVTMDPTALTASGSNLPITILQPYLVINYIIALTGIFPSRS